MIARLLSRRSFILANAGVVLLLLAAPVSVLAAQGGGHGPNSTSPGASAGQTGQGNSSSHAGHASPGNANSSSPVISQSNANSNSSVTSQSSGKSNSAGSGGSHSSGNTNNHTSTSGSSSGLSNHNSTGDSNQEDVWVDGYSTASAPVVAAGPGHEMDPHLGCPAYIILWGSGLADSSGIYTVDGWSPSGSGTGDYGHPGYKQDQAWPYDQAQTQANPRTASWTYDTSAGGTQEISYINTAQLVAHALANGDQPVNGEGLHFKLQFVQDPQKHKTFWVNCQSPIAPPSTGPDLSINKTVSETTASFGDTLTYQITVSNTGAGAASNVTVDDFMGGTAGYSVNMNSFSSTPQTSSFTTLGTGDFEWTYSSIAGGTSDTMTYTAIINQPTNGYVSTHTYLLNNTATITSPTCTVAAQCTSTVTTTVPPSTPTPGPDLIVTKSVDHSSTALGHTLDYTITVTNAGNAPATDVAMTDLMTGTAGFQVNDGSNGTNDSFLGNPTVTVSEDGPGVYTWEYSTLAPEQTATVTYTATILAPGSVSSTLNGMLTLVNTVTATSGNGGCTSNTCTATVTTTAPPPSGGSLGVTTTKTPPQHASGVLGASTPGTGAHLDLLLTLILVLAGLTLIGFAIATRPRAKPQV